MILIDVLLNLQKRLVTIQGASVFFTTFNNMKRIIWLSMLVFGMLAFTGFATTSDLTDNSDIVFVDNDVGDVVAITIAVDQKEIVHVKSYAMHSKTQELKELISNSFDLTFSEIQNDYICISADRWQPPERNNLNSPGINFRTPRDSL